MRGVLVRVAIDQAYGKWNGPVDPVTNDFVYVSIPDKHEFAPGLATPYSHMAPALAGFARGREVRGDVALPSPLARANVIDDDRAGSHAALREKAMNRLERAKPKLRVREHAGRC